MTISEFPQISAPLPWQSREWVQLTQQLANGQLPHALLLVGMQNTGKSQLALALSRLLLCSQEEGLLNCGNCHACVLSASGSHGDFRWVEPVEKSRIIKIEQIRELVRFTHQKAGLGLRKVVVINPADSMNVHALNALLKSLEEPSRDTYFILVCNRMQSVSPTIRSRCQIIRLETPQSEQCLVWLDETTGARQQSERLLSLANGLPMLAQQLYATGDVETFARQRFKLEALLGGKITASQVGALWSDIDLDIFLSHLVTELQRLLASFALDRLKTAQGRGAFRLLDEVARLQQAVSAGANPSKQLVVDALLAKFCSELGAGPLGDKLQAQSGGVCI
jgi:DNA polymerase III subunit delta'